MPLTSKDIVLDKKHLSEAIRIFLTALDEIKGMKIGTWEAYHALQVCAMMFAEQGMIRGVSQAEFKLVKKDAQIEFIKKYSKRPDLWIPQTEK